MPLTQTPVMDHPPTLNDMHEGLTASRAATHGVVSPPVRVGLIAGEGHLPLRVAENAVQQGVQVIPLCLSWGNRDGLKKITGKTPLAIAPGLWEKTFGLLTQHHIQHVVFAGKVNKWILFRDPRLDRRALSALASQLRRNDDALMLRIIDELAQVGMTVLPQTAFLQDCFVPPVVLSQRQPDPQDWEDIRAGFELAKTLGQVDVGQTVVMRQGMALALEAIEGTDACLLRAGKLANRRGGVVVKVAKPNQDERFDVPSVGLRTLKTMRRAGLHCLATEANATFYLEQADMVTYANRYGLSLVSVDAAQLS
jgi:DUF1009 family protein